MLLVTLAAESLQPLLMPILMALMLPVVLCLRLILRILLVVILMVTIVHVVMVILPGAVRDGVMVLMVLVSFLGVGMLRAWLVVIRGYRCRPRGTVRGSQ